MANAAEAPFVKHPALLALFAPRPPPPFKAPMPSKSMPKLTGIAAFLQEFGKEETHINGSDTDKKPVIKYETPTEKKERIKKEKEEAHRMVLAEREKKWDPHNNPNATKDPYKTLFVARLSYELNEDDLRREFERYGRIRDVKLIRDTENKSRGYAFIEFERSNDLKEAFQHADGHKLKGRRILVDVERGRTVKTWKPRKLGGGLGKTRAGPKEKVKLYGASLGRHKVSPYKSSSGSYKDRDKDRDRRRDRDKHSHRDYRDRDKRSSRDDRRDRDRDRDRGRDRRDRDKRRSRSRSRDRNKHQSSSKRRDRDRDTERDRDRHSRKDRDRDTTTIKSDHKDSYRDRDRDRKSSRATTNDYSRTSGGDRTSGGHRDRDRHRTDRGDNKDRDRSRRKRSRSRERYSSRR